MEKIRVVGTLVVAGALGLMGSGCSSPSKKPVPTDSGAKNGEARGGGGDAKAGTDAKSGADSKSADSKSADSKAPDAHADTTPGLFETEETCQLLKQKLAGFTAPATTPVVDGKPVLRVQVFQNRSSGRLDKDALTERIATTVVDSGKFTVRRPARDLAPERDYDMNSTEVKPEPVDESKALILAGWARDERSVQDGRQSVTWNYHLEIRDGETVLLAADKQFRLTKEAGGTVEAK